MLQRSKSQKKFLPLTILINSETQELGRSKRVRRKTRPFLQENANQNSSLNSGDDGQSASQLLEDGLPPQSTSRNFIYFFNL